MLFNLFSLLYRIWSCSTYNLFLEVLTSFVLSSMVNPGLFPLTWFFLLFSSHWLFFLSSFKCWSFLYSSFSFSFFTLSLKDFILRTDLKYHLYANEFQDRIFSLDLSVELQIHWYSSQPPICVSCRKYPIIFLITCSSYVATPLMKLSINTEN